MRRRLILIASVVALVLVGAQVAAGAPAASKKANIYVVASKSFCLASGIADAYTGDGKIVFYVTLRNSVNTAGKVNIVPVRHYDDGGLNESAMDMLIDVRVPARTTKKFKSPLYSYKAHEHEIAGCGLKIGSHSEVRIQASHL
jgi:hypothetical protein